MKNFNLVKSLTKVNNITSLPFRKGLGLGRLILCFSLATLGTGEVWGADAVYTLNAGVKDGKGGTISGGIYNNVSDKKPEVSFENISDESKTISTKAGTGILDAKRKVKISATEKSGYTFGGWYNSTAYTTQVSTEKSLENVPEKKQSTTWNYYAKFTPNTYTIAFDGNGGTVSTGSVTATYDADMPYATAPTRTGYKFDGYFDATSGGNKYYNADMSSAKTWDKTSATTLYARWIPIYYAIAYTYAQDNGQTWVTINGTAFSGGFSKANDSSSKETTGGSANTYTIEAYAQPNEGYVFKGWYKNADCSGEPISMGDANKWNKYTESITQTLKNPGTEVKLYAKFEEGKSYTYYATAYAEARTESGEKKNGVGLIYISCKGNKPTTDSQYTASDGQDYGNNNPATTENPSINVTADYYAKALAGYSFGGWYKEEALTNAVGKGTLQSEGWHYQEVFAATSTDENNPTTIYRYAKFVPVTVSAAEKQTVNFTTGPGTETATIVFPVTNVNHGKDDFNEPSISGDGWTISSWNYADNKVSVVVSFTVSSTGPAAGKHNSTITLSSKAGSSNTGEVEAFIDINPTDTWSGANQYYVDDSDLNLKTLWTTTSSGAKTYSFTYTPSGSNNGSVEPSMSDGVLKINRAGTYNLTLTQAAGGYYNSKTFTKQITVIKKTPSFGDLSKTSFMVGETATIAVSNVNAGDPSLSSDGEFYFETAPASIVTLTRTNASTLTLTAVLAATDASLKLVQKENRTFNAGEKTYSPLSISRYTTNLSVSPTSCALNVGSSQYITVSTNNSEEVKVTSSNNTIAGWNASTGNIEAHAAGDATITFKQEPTNKWTEATAIVNVTVSLVPNNLQVAETHEMKVNDTWTNVLTEKNSDAELVVSNSNSDVAIYDANTNTITAKKKGTVTFTFSQAATIKYEAIEKTVTVTVNKKSNAISVTLNGVATTSSEMYYSTGIEAVVISNNTSKPISVEQTEGSTIATYYPNDNAIYALAAAGKAQWRFWQEEDDVYSAATEVVVTVNVIKPNHNVPFTYNSELYGDNKFTVEKHAPKGIGSGSNLSYDNNTNTLTVGDALGGGGNFNDKYIVIHFEGVPDKVNLNFNTRSTVPGLGERTRVEFFIMEAAEQASNPFESGDDKCSATDSRNAYYSAANTQDDPVSISAQLKPTTRWIKICYSGNYAGVIQGLNVTELHYLEAADPETSQNNPYDFEAKALGADDDTKSFNVNWANIAPVTVTCSDPTHFSVTPSGFAQYGELSSQAINVTYHRSVDIAEHSATITISNGTGTGTYTQYIYVKGETTKKSLAFEWNKALSSTGYVMNVGEAYPSADVNYIAQLALEDEDKKVTFSSSDHSVIEVSEDGKSIHAVGAGTSEITAIYPGSDQYNETSSKQTFTVDNKLKQTISWSQNLMGLKWGDSPLTLNAKASSGGVVTYSIQEGSDACVSLSGTNNAILNISNSVAGEAYIIATQAGGEIEGQDYFPITMVKRVIVRDPASQCDEYALAGESCTFSNNLTKPQVYELAGTPISMLTFSAYHDEYSGSWAFVHTYAPLKIDQYVMIDNAWQWQNIFNEVVKQGTSTQYSATVNESATKIRVYSSEEASHHVSNLSIKRAKFMTSSDASLIETIDINTLYEKPIKINHSNIDVMTVTVNDDFNESNLSTSTLGDGCGSYGEDAFTFSFTPTQAKTYQGTITISDGKADETKVEIPIELTAQAISQTIVGFTSEAETHWTTDNVTFNGRVLSDNPVYYTSSDETVAKIDGNKLQILKSGTVTITAHCDTVGAYAAAPDIAKVITINKAIPTVTTNPTAGICYRPCTLNEVSLSGGDALVAGTFQWMNTSEEVKVGTNNYNAKFIPEDQVKYAVVENIAISVTPSFKDQTITWNPAATYYGCETIAADAEASSGLAVTYSSNNSGVISAEQVTNGGWTITIKSPGTAIITVSQAGNETYAAAASVSKTITVEKCESITIEGTITASDILVGTALSTSTLNTTNAKAYFTLNSQRIEVAGSFGWKTPAKTLDGYGTYQEIVVFTPSNPTLYGSASQEVSITATTHQIKFVEPLPTATATVFQTLSDAVLSHELQAKSVGDVQIAADIDVEASSIEWEFPNQVLSAGGTYIYRRLFTPTLSYFEPKYADIQVTVAKLTPVITNVPTTIFEITTEQTLNTASQTKNVLSQCVAKVNEENIAGTFSWVNGNETLAEGDQKATIRFTPSNTDAYESVTAEVAIRVIKIVTPSFTPSWEVTGEPFNFEILSTQTITMTNVSPAGDENFEYSCSPSDAITIERNDDVLTLTAAKVCDNVVITLHQKKTLTYKESTQTFSFKVVRKANTVLVNNKSEETIEVAAEGTTNVTFTSEHASDGFTISTTEGTGNATLDAEGKVTGITSNGTTVFTILQERTEIYEAGSATLIVKVKPIFKFEAIAEVYQNAGGIVEANVVESKVEDFDTQSSSATATFKVKEITEGYTFLGWYSDEECQTRVSETEEYKPLIENNNPDKTESLTLWAKFTNKYVVTLNNQGATTAGTTNVTAEYGKVMPTVDADGQALVAPQKTGYIFGGYYLGDVLYYDASMQPTTATWPNVEGGELSAKWTPITYSVLFHGNGNTDGKADYKQTGFVYDVEENLQENAFNGDWKVKLDGNGYVLETAELSSARSFTGWAESETGEKKYDNNASVSNLTATQGGVVDLYAKWGTPAEVTLPALTRIGYVFLGWKINETTFAGGQKYIPTANEQTLIAQWEAVEVTGVTTPATLNFTTPDTKDATIEFTVTNGAKAEDFTYSVTGEGWSNPSLSVNGAKATITATYTATLSTTKGDHTATVTLTSKGNSESSKSTTATANVNFTLTKVQWEGETSFTADVEPFVPTFHAYFNTTDVTEQVSPMTYTLTPVGQTVAKIEDGKIVCLSRGEVYIQATTKETATYSSVTSQPVELTFTGLPDEIVWNNGEDLPTFIAGDIIPHNIAQSKNDQTIAVSFASSDATIVKVEGGTVTAIKPGTITLTATTAGNEKYEPATSSKSITIGKRALTLEWDQSFINFDDTQINTVIDLTSIVRDAITGEILSFPVTYSFIPLGTAAASISGTQLTLLAIGSGVVRATVYVPEASQAIYDPITEDKNLRIRKAGEKCNTTLEVSSQHSFNMSSPYEYEFSARPCDEISYTISHGTLVYREFNVFLVSQDGTTTAIRSSESAPSSEKTYTDPVNGGKTGYVKLQFTTGASGAYYVKNISIHQRSYLSCDQTSISVAPFAHQDWTYPIVIDYSDIPVISYSVSNNSGANLSIAPEEGTEIKNDCGDWGSYTFILSGTWPGPKTYEEVITFTTTAGDKLEIPIHLVVNQPGTFTFDNGAGTGDGKWNNPSNWLCGTYEHGLLPQAYNDVIIQNDVLVETPVDVYSLSIMAEMYSTTTITVQPQAGISVHSGGVSQTANTNIVLQSSIEKNKEGQAYFRVDPNAVKKIMPSAIVQLATRSTLDNGANKDATWQYIGVPVRLDPTHDYYNFTVDYITWLYEWSESEGWLHGWNYEPEPVQLYPFHGYAITQYGQPIYEFTGQLLNSNQDITLTYTPQEPGMYGDNLFANSYASPIDVKRFTDEDFVGDLDKTFYIFNSGSWNEWDDMKEKIIREHNGTLLGGVPGQYIAIPALGAKNLDESYDQTMIAPMQGVYVYTNENGAKIKLNYEKHVWNAKPRNSSYSQMNKPARAPQRAWNDTIAVDTTAIDSADIITLSHRVRMVALGENSGADVIYVMEDKNYTNQYDNGYDAPKIFADADGIVGLYTNEENTGLMAVAATNSVDSMYIGFQAGDDSEYSLYITSVIGDSLLLLDTETEEMFALVDSATYNFHATPNQANDFRFRIIDYGKRMREQGHYTPTSWQDVNRTNVRIWYAKHKLYITDAKKNSLAHIYTADGALVSTTPFDCATSINVDNLASGVYFVHVDNTVYKFVTL